MVSQITASDFSSVSKKKALLIVKFDSKEFSNLNGDFLGRPYIKISTYQHSTFKVILNDSKDEIRPTLNLQQDVEVFWGFAPGGGVAPVSRKVFKGEIFSIARKFPDGCEVVVIDTAYRMQQDIGSSVSYSGEGVAGAVSKPGEVPKSELAARVISTFTGEASYYGGGDGFDGNSTASGQKFDATKLTAAHKTLPFGTQVRVTNLANKKNTVVKINDRGPYVAGRVLDLSKAAAAAIGLVEAGKGQVKAEVLAQAGESLVGKDAFQDLKNQRDGQPTKSEAKPTSTSLAYAKDTNIEFIDKSSPTPRNAGEVRVGQSRMKKIANDASLQGDTVVVRGDAIEQVAAGNGETTNFVLDYKTGRDAIASVTISKRTGLQLKSGYGALSVVGWSVNDKTTVGATVVTPLNPPPHPTGFIQVPDWGQVNLKQAIVTGGRYTWADATKNGTRIPSKEIMQRIAALSPVLERYTDATVGKGKKWQINSWFRDPASNRRCGGKSNSRHLYGDAADVVFPTMFQWHRKMYDSYDGGLAIKPGEFVHIDLGQKRRWTY